MFLDFNDFNSQLFDDSKDLVVTTEWNLLFSAIAHLDGLLFKNHLSCIYIVTQNTMQPRNLF